MRDLDSGKIHHHRSPLICPLSTPDYSIQSESTLRSNGNILGNWKSTQPTTMLNGKASPVAHPPVVQRCLSLACPYSPLTRIDMPLVNFPTLYGQRHQNHHHNHLINRQTMTLPSFS
ncbi:hypothetical protein J1N35_034977 [Gossypium stocksii]|uniref:Uncharacterized protein n=1 Tax=Gossypium stocksii TaxID=47602 RepID=A0A9D3UT39_9ROSI|nr:hypothetical protein J1N35_034977 [Gossypium stocksii]